MDVGEKQEQRMPIDGRCLLPRHPPAREKCRSAPLAGSRAFYTHRCYSFQGPRAIYSALRVLVTDSLVSFSYSRLTIHSLGKDGGSRGYSQRWDALSDTNRFSSPPPTDLLLRMLALNSDDARLALPYLSS